MAKFLYSLCVLVLFFSCQNKDNIDKIKKSEKTEKKFIMYQLSEMALLMEQMYVENQRLKIRIEKGEVAGSYPEYFNKIFVSKFTDESDNDSFFKTNATHFIEVQKKLYSDPNNVKQNYNNGINSCITCHKGKCGGPLTKIKKLLIK